MGALLKKLIYPTIGAVILTAYVSVVRRGIEPFEVATERGEVPAAPARHASTRYRRTPSVFWIGGFGGK